MNLLGPHPGGNVVKLTSRQIGISYELPGTGLLGPERPALRCLVHSINLVFKWAELLSQSERSKLRNAAACLCQRKVMQGLCVVQRANSMYWQAETPWNAIVALRMLACMCARWLRSWRTWVSKVAPPNRTVLCMDWPCAVAPRIWRPREQPMPPYRWDSDSIYVVVVDDVDHGFTAPPPPHTHTHTRTQTERNTRQT